LARCGRVQQLLFSCSFNFVKLVTRFLCTRQTGGAQQRRYWRRTG